MYLNIREKKEALYVKTTGQKIKSLRIALGLSQEQLSEAIVLRISQFIVTKQENPCPIQLPW